MSPHNQSLLTIYHTSRNKKNFPAIQKKNSPFALVFKTFTCNKSFQTLSHLNSLQSIAMILNSLLYICLAYTFKNSPESWRERENEPERGQTKTCRRFFH